MEYLIAHPHAHPVVVNVLPRRFPALEVRGVRPPSLPRSHSSDPRSTSPPSTRATLTLLAGALLALPAAERTPAVLSRVDELLTELSELVGHKRILGHAPATEVFIVRRMNAYKAKHARWVREGKLTAEIKWWETIAVSPAAGESSISRLLGGR